MDEVGLLSDYDRSKDRRKKVIIIAATALFGVVVLAAAVIAIVTLTKSSTPSPSPSPDNKGHDYQYFHQYFADNLEPQKVRDEMEYFSSMPHIAGSVHDHQQALYVAATWEGYGIKTRVENYTVLLTYPEERSVEIVFPEEKKFKCSLKEAVVDDGTSGNPEAIATWNGYSNSGNATGELVYANYGTLEDYQYLDSQGVNFTGKIVIVRYGKIFRGNKASMAQDRGAIGVLIYVDPGDTGYLRGPVYMEGPYSSNSTVQRGSVWNGNGDPTTPGWPSSGEFVPRISEADARDPSKVTYPLPLIPIQPLSYGDAQPLLEALGGMLVPNSNWGGGFNLTHVGPGPVQVNVYVKANFTLTPIWNVIGTIEGEMEPDRLVLMGCHRDAWTFGAGDPISGHSILMESARVFGEMLGIGWRPRRSIVLTSWDAEEYGLIGSIEFAETYYKTLQAQAVAYLNLDTGVTGTDFLFVTGTPNFESILKDLTKGITLPNSQETVASVWAQNQTIIPMGTGSDHTAFLMHCGISAVYMGFQANGDPQPYEAVYHSNYDSFYWFTHFGDTTFEYHTTLAKVFGGLGLALADNTFLPYNFVDYSNSLEFYVTQFDEEYSEDIDFTPLMVSIENLHTAGVSIQKEIAAASESSNQLLIRSINDRLMLSERSFLATSAESGSNWFLHVIYAPSNTNAYAGSVFPSIGDAIYNKDWVKAQFLVMRIAQTINGAAEYLTGNFV